MSNRIKIRNAIKRAGSLQAAWPAIERMNLSPDALDALLGAREGIGLKMASNARSSSRVYDGMVIKSIDDMILKGGKSLRIIAMEKKVSHGLVHNRSKALRVLASKPQKLK